MTDPATPFYDATKADQGWSPEELRPPFDLGVLVAQSYRTVEEKMRTRHSLRTKIAQRQKAKARRRPRRVSLP